MDALTYNSLTKLNNLSSITVTQTKPHGKLVYSLSTKFDPQNNMTKDSIKVKQLL